MTNLTIEEMAVFCKRKGFAYPSAEIYGGFAGFYDFGHLGVELKNNIKQEWWDTFVKQRPDVIGIDGSIITNPNVWKASGHVEGFTDILVDCRKCGMRYRADHLLEDAVKIETAGMAPDEVSDLIKEHNIKCRKCKSLLEKPKRFNLMFTTNIGPIQTSSSLSYLRPETAQLIFTNFRLAYDNARMKLPFGIAQIGKAFRNEISPRDFLFRMREFEQMEIEYFVHPDKTDCPYTNEISGLRANVYTAEMQKKKEEPREMLFKELMDKKIISTKWHAYWLGLMYWWFVDLGANPKNFRIRQHIKDELSHYASETWDLEYRFPFGWKELQGLSNRADYDLRQHIKHSKTDLSIYDEETNKKIIPYVICEPSQGVERAFLAFMFDAYEYDKKRGNVVLKLHPRLAPVKLGVFPLVNKLENAAKKIYNDLKRHYNSIYDSKGSIGKRYARQDEIGTPICITVDFQTLEDSTVTLRDRNTTSQIRVKISELKKKLDNIFINNDLNDFSS